MVMKQIKDLAKRIARDFRPEKIILFGSHASGRGTPDSDADLLVILSHEDKPWRVAARIRGKVRPEFPVDLIVRAPKEIKKRLSGGDPFLHEIIEKGKVLYEKSNL